MTNDNYEEQYYNESEEEVEYDDDLSFLNIEKKEEPKEKVEVLKEEPQSTEENIEQLQEQRVNDTSTLDFMAGLNIANIQRVKVDDEEHPVTETIGETLLNPTVTTPSEFTKQTETTETTEQGYAYTAPQGATQETVQHHIDVFNTGLDVPQMPNVSSPLHNGTANDEHAELIQELDAKYKQAQEQQEQAKVDLQSAADNEPEHYIFSSIFSGTKEDRDYYRKELLLEFAKNNIFEDEFYVFYQLLQDLPKVTITKRFLQVYLQNHQATYARIPEVNINKYRLGDNDPYAEFVANVVQTFERCSNMEVDGEEFHTNMEIKKMTYISMETIRTFAEGTQIITEGLGNGRYSKAGYTDMRMHINKSFTQLDNLIHKTNRKGAIVYGKTDIEDDSKTGGILFKFGIKALDEALGGMNKGMMLSLLAPPKGFKTRLSTFILHSAIVQGVNSLAWSLENGYKGVECLLRARHFYWYYGQNGLNEDGLLTIDAKDILDGTLDPKIAELEEASRIDLFHNEDYGTFVNMDAVFEVDTFVDTIETEVKLHNIDFVLLDYLQLVEGQNVQGTKSEKVGLAYQRSLRMIKNNNISGLFPGQIKQSVISELSRLSEDELEEYELRDAGAESSEVIRTPDINIMIYGTKRMIDEGKSYLLSVPSRYSKPFKPIKLAVKAAHCTFASVPNDAW